MQSDHGYYSGARTDRDNLFVLWKDNGNYFGCHDVVESLDDIKDDEKYPEAFLSVIEGELGLDYEIYLDI